MGKGGDAAQHFMKAGNACTVSFLCLALITTLVLLYMYVVRSIRRVLG